MTIKQKMVVLPESKVLPKNGGMYGPIDTPHMVSVEDIKLMLFYGAEIFEVFEDKKVKLTNENYNKDNSSELVEDEEEDDDEDDLLNISTIEEVKPTPQVKSQPAVQQSKNQPVQKQEKRK